MRFYWKGQRQLVGNVNSINERRAKTTLRDALSDSALTLEGVWFSDSPDICFCFLTIVRIRIALFKSPLLPSTSELRTSPPVFASPIFQDFYSKGVFRSNPRKEDIFRKNGNSEYWRRRNHTYSIGGLGLLSADGIFRPWVITIYRRGPRNETSTFFTTWRYPPVLYNRHHAIFVIG